MDDAPSQQDYSAGFLSYLATALSEGGSEETVEQFVAARQNRMRFVANRTLPELEGLIGPIRGLRVLDYGCGAGASTVALHRAGAELTGFDVDRLRTEIAPRLLAEHGVTGVEVFHGPSAAAAGVERHGFDLVYLNAVIEHVPVRERAAVLDDIASSLRPGGHIAIAQSPNRWWPRDVYLTGLWFLPWLPAGSAIGTKYAARAGRLKGRIGTSAADALKLEIRGAWGVTYPELSRHLPSGTECVNARPEHRSTSMASWSTSSRRRVVERAFGTVVTPITGLPVASVSPMFSLLVFRVP